MAAPLLRAAPAALGGCGRRRPPPGSRHAPGSAGGGGRRAEPEPARCLCPCPCPCPSALPHGPSRRRRLRCRQRCPAPGYPCRAGRRGAAPPSPGLHRSAVRRGPYGPGCHSRSQPAPAGRSPPAPVSSPTLRQRENARAARSGDGQERQRGAAAARALRAEPTPEEEGRAALRPAREGGGKGRGTGRALPEPPVPWTCRLPGSLPHQRSCSAGPSAWCPPRTPALPGGASPAPQGHLPLPWAHGAQLLRAGSSAGPALHRTAKPHLLLLGPRFAVALVTICSFRSW